MMVVTSPRLSGLILIVIPVIVLPIVAFGRRVRIKSRFAQDRLADASAFAAEAVGGVRTVQAYTLEASAIGRFASLVEQSFAAARGATLSRALLTAFAIFLVFGSVVAVLWLGAHSVLAGEMSAGTLGQFLLYSVFAAGALARAEPGLGRDRPGGRRDGAARRAPRDEAEDRRAEIRSRFPEPARGEVAFDNVHFAYDGAGLPVLRGITLKVAARRARRHRRPVGRRQVDALRAPHALLRSDRGHACGSMAWT